MNTYRVGAVAYHPRVVTIWEGFRDWFRTRGFPIEYVLFATYGQQLEALFAGTVDVAWNTNLAYVQARERSGGACAPLAMRDTDRDWTSHAVVPAGAPAGLDSLRGRRVGFGDADSPQAYILPAFHMRRQGLDPFSDLTLFRLDRDLGKHGDTGGAELAQLERLRSGELDACILSQPTLAALRADGSAEDLEVAWTTPPFHHCNFTALEESRPEHERFLELLLQMDPDDQALCEPMRLESAHRWVDADESGYADLVDAVRSGLGA
jgi:ABC-type phosphate/phosphonate transport system substrate-binding protein